jgi:hypothetical protein
MGSIRNNASTFVANYMLGQQLKSLVIPPGISLNIPDDDIDAMLQHPIIKGAYENETLEVLTRTPVVTSELEGFTVVDSRRNGEPLPIFETPRTAIVPEEPKPDERIAPLSKAQLLEFDGIGEGYATKIISRQPEQGYSSFGELKAKNGDLTKLKEEHWEEIRKTLKK